MKLSTVSNSHFIKKGYDFLEQINEFSDPDTILKLGVGKNMVQSIRFWLEAFGITRDFEITEFGDRIFAENGFYPFLEDMGTLWLLHCSLIKTEVASIYTLFFNKFRK